MVFRFISRNLAILTLAGAGAAYLWPAVFAPLGAVFLGLFAATMFCLGLVLDAGEARDAWTRPGRIALGVATQYTVMPLLSFAAALVVERAGGSPALALGFLVVGCAPGAMARVPRPGRAQGFCGSGWRGPQGSATQAGWLPVQER
jgi:BASS family bile acid:Na+ symporter